MKQFPNFRFSPNVLHFETFKVILFVFSLHTRSSSCQIGKCTSKLLLHVIPLIALKNDNALDLPLSWKSLNIRNCTEQSSIVHTCAEVDYHIYIYIYFIDRHLKILWSSGYSVGPPFSRRVDAMVQILTGFTHLEHPGDIHSSLSLRLRIYISLTPD